MGGIGKELNPSVLPLSKPFATGDPDRAIRSFLDLRDGVTNQTNGFSKMGECARVERYKPSFSVPIHKLPSRQAQSEVMDGRGLSVARVTAVNLTPSNRASPSRFHPQVAVPGLGNGLDDIMGKALFDLPKPRVKTGKRLRCPGSWPGTRQRQGQQGGEGTRKGGRV